LFISPSPGLHLPLLRSRPNEQVDVIVVTDGERILGIGDQGAAASASHRKLSLYTLIGGIHPARTLPIVLDVGTNNPVRLKNPDIWAGVMSGSQDKITSTLLISSCRQ